MKIDILWILQAWVVWSMVVEARSAQANKPTSQPVSIQLHATASLELTAHWSPMTRGSAKLDQDPRYASYYQAKVHVKKRRYHRDALQIWLPTSPVSVGKIWKIDQQKLHDFFSQFHPGVSTKLHQGGPDGAYAMIRAVSADYVEIAFRVHLEFVLKPGAIFYTPAQFMGHLLIHRHNQHPVSMRLYVPTTRRLNVDLNADRAIDAAFVPRMELVGGNTQLRRGLRWSHRIPRKTVDLRLSQQFYAFMQIQWHDVASGLRTAGQQNKPIHLFAVFGSLDDESC